MAYLNSLGLFPSAFIFYSFLYFSPFSLRTFTEEDLKAYRDKVAAMFRHAYESYLTNAFPFDELKPLSCHGIDTWGSFSLTLIDALDTLAVMRNYSEFRRVVSHLVSTADFNININVSVFETNIRVVGGLISAHLLSHKAGMELEPGWPCSGPLLQLAEAVARRLLPAFETSTGMPYGTVNLRHGVPPGETPVTCTAGVSTFVLEFGTLTRLTGDPVFEQVAHKALDALWERRSSVGLVGNHINIQEGKWTAMDAGIGGGIDSYYEYLLKGAILFQDPKLMHMFKEYQRVIEKYMEHDDWYFWVSMGAGQVTMPVFQSLESFWPGLLSLVGDNEQALKTLYNYHQVWKQYGFTPEFYDVSHSHVKREGYPLRPELIESVMYLYRATKDPHLLEIGVDILESIEYSAKTECGYATVKSVVDHRIEDRMESFFLAETTKYLYLLFDPNNFIHSNGSCGEIIRTTGGDCLLETGGYVFNTEAHPIDIAAVYCCSKDRKDHDALLHSFQKTMNLYVLFNINGRGDFLHIFKQSQKRRRKRKASSVKTNVSDKSVDKNGHKNLNKIKTTAVEKQYSQEPLISGKTDASEVSSTELKGDQTLVNDVSNSASLTSSGSRILSHSHNSILGDSFFVNFMKSGISSQGEIADVVSGKLSPKEANSFVIKDNDSKHGHHKKIRRIPKASEMLIRNFEHDDSLEEHSVSSAADSNFPIEAKSSEDLDFPLFDRSSLMKPSEYADRIFQLSVMNDSSRKRSLGSKVNSKKSNFFSRARYRTIPSVPTIPLTNAKNLDLNVSSVVVKPLSNFDVLSCPAQSFISRLSVMGEMVNTDL